MASSAFAFPSYIITKGASTDSCKSTSLSSSPSTCPRPNNNCHLLFSRPISSGPKYQSAKFAKPDSSLPKCCLTDAKQVCAVGRRKSMMMGLLMSGLMVLETNLPKAFALTPVFREYIDTFDGYSFKYPQNWIQVRGAGADIFFRDPVVLDENLSVEFSSPSSSKYLSLEDLGSPEEAGKGVLRQYLTEFMSTRLGVRREGNILSTSSRVAESQTDFVGRRRSMMMGLLMSGLMVSETNLPKAFALTPVFREYIDTFDGYSFKYPQNWIQVRGAGADIFFRDPVVLDENLSVEFSSPSSSKYLSLEDLGSPEEAGKGVLRQYLTEFMSTRLGVRREGNILSTSSRVADDGKLYYQVEVNIKSYANNNELAVMPEDRVARLEWNRRYLAVLGVENNRLYSLRLQTPEKVFLEEEKDLRRVMDSFRVEKI